MNIEIIRTTSPRQSFCPEKKVFLPQLAQPPAQASPDYFDEYFEWTHENWWWVDYFVHFSHKDEAKYLALKLDGLLLHDSGSREVLVIIEKLKSMRAKECWEMTDLEKWQRTAFSLPDDIGGGYAVRGVVTRFLSERYTGKVLEAMCGFNSYFLPSLKRTVVALDYCREMLERYPFPERLRICCDLNQLSPTTGIPCFRRGEFDAIVICFGFKYTRHPKANLREFGRILKPTGVLAFVENPMDGYGDRCKRKFEVKSLIRLLRVEGFLPTFERIPIEEGDVRESDYLHVAGRKANLE